MSGSLGRAEVGDEVIVNVQALDLGLGSGGFDIVHVNLTRGLGAEGAAGADVMKLNYTSLQHAVKPVEDERLQLPVERPGRGARPARPAGRGRLGLRTGRPRQHARVRPDRGRRAARRALAHGSRAARARAARGSPDRGSHLWGEGEAISTAGALHHALRTLGWDAAMCGPGPGIVGSGSPLGHGGMSALDSAHASLALGCPTLLVARMSSGDGRARHRGISHHTLTVLDLLLEPVTVALPAGMRSPVGADLRAGLGAVFGAGMPSRAGPGAAMSNGPARITRHDWRRAVVDLPAYAASGLPRRRWGAR